MGILIKIRRALEKHEVTVLKKKVARIEIEATKQGKTIQSLTVVLNSSSVFPLHRLDFVLSDGTTNKKQPKKPGKNNIKLNRVAPVEESPTELPSGKKVGLRPTLVGKSCDYDEKSVLVEDDDDAGVKVSLIVRRDGIRDILKIKWSEAGSVAQRAIWWIENEEKVCRKFNVTAARPPKGPLISFRVRRIKN